MELLKNMNLNKKVQYIVAPIVIVLLVASLLIVNSIYRNIAINNTQHQSEVYMNKIAQILDIAEQQTGAGYSSADYTIIKPYFSTPAYYETDFPLLASKNGSYLIHIQREGRMLPSEITFHFNSSNAQQGSITYNDLNSKNQTVKRILFYQFYKPYNAYIAISVNPEEAVAKSTSHTAIMVLIVALFILAVYFIFYLLFKPISTRLLTIKHSIGELTEGIIPSHISTTSNDDLGSIIRSLNLHFDNLRATANFTNSIANHNLNQEYTPLGNLDTLGNSLINLRNNLIINQDEEVKRKKEDEIRAWTNAGLAKFADILRQNNNNLSVLSDIIIQNIVNYLNANQGGIFIINDTDSNKHLELLATFAYNRKKIIQKTIAMGEGLVGTCAVEKQTIYLKEIPNNYISITSGLGEATPTNLLIAPLKQEEAIYGVIEIASFGEFAPHEIEFVEKVGVSIASTLNSVKNSIQTQYLLEQAQQQREEMSAQEEEMRQNMEEMQATQEEMSRKQVEFEAITATINQNLVFISLNEEGAITDANTNTSNLLGLNKQDIVGESLIDLVSKDQRNELMQAWDRVRTGESQNITLHMISEGNKDCYLQATIAPELDEMGYATKILLIGKDITETMNIEERAQKQVEELNLKLLNVRSAAVEENRVEKQFLFEALAPHCLVTIIDATGIITSTSGKYAEFGLGIKDEVEGRSFFEIDHQAKLNPDKFKKMWSNLQKGIAQQRESSLQINNKTVWIQDSFTPIIDENKSLDKVICIGFDITNIKKQQSELTQLRMEINKFKE